MCKYNLYYTKIKADCWCNFRISFLSQLTTGYLPYNPGILALAEIRRTQTHATLVLQMQLRINSPEFGLLKPSPQDYKKKGVIPEEVSIPRIIRVFSVLVTRMHSLLLLCRWERTASTSFLHTTLGVCANFWCKLFFAKSFS